VPGIDLTTVTADVGAARRALHDQAVDVVVVAPPDLEANFEAGKQSTIRVEYNVVSPVKANYAYLLAQQLAQLEAAEGTCRAGAGGGWGGRGGGGRGGGGHRIWRLT